MIFSSHSLFSGLLEYEWTVMSWNVNNMHARICIVRARATARVDGIFRASSWFYHSQGPIPALYVVV